MARPKKILNVNEATQMIQTGAIKPFEGAQNIIFVQDTQHVNVVEDVPDEEQITNIMNICRELGALEVKRNKENPHVLEIKHIRKDTYFDPHNVGKLVDFAINMRCGLRRIKEKLFQHGLDIS